MTHVQAECLDFAALHGKRLRLFRIQKPLLFQARDIRQNLFQLRVRKLDVRAAQMIGGLFVALVQRTASRVVQITLIVICKNVNHTGTSSS